MNELEEGNKFLPQFEKRGGLLPAVVQDAETREILMLGWVNKEALELSVKTRRASFFSTSRKQLWTKGESSGNYLEIQHILTDCDQDALVYLVRPSKGGACHTKGMDGLPRKSCFYRSLDLASFTLIKEEKGGSDTIEHHGP